MYTARSRLTPSLLMSYREIYFLLCSDGLSDIIDVHQELASLLQQLPSSDMPQGLISNALSEEPRDNLTAVVVEAISLPEEKEEEDARAEEVKLTLETLQQMYMFQHLQLEELIRVMEHAEVEEVPSGKLICKEGEPGDCLYLILRGQLEVSSNGSTLASLSQGNHVGEMSLLCGTPRSANVSSSTDSRLLKVDREEFYSLIREDPQVGVRILSVIAHELGNRLQSTNKMIP